MRGLGAFPPILISFRGRARCPHRAAASRTDGALGQTRLTDRLLATAARGEKSELDVGPCLGELQFKARLRLVVFQFMPFAVSCLRQRPTES